jgi:hypothetical protein
MGTNLPVLGSYSQLHGYKVPDFMSYHKSIHTNLPVLAGYSQLPGYDVPHS